MKVCFHHEDFDRDVSSGTIHALYQWFELLQAFGVHECAIINTTADVLPTISSEMVVREYSDLASFEAAAITESLTYVEKGGVDYRSLDYSQCDWLVFGGTGGLPSADIGITTNGSLYPREAAAIILASA